MRFVERHGLEAAFAGPSWSAGRAPGSPPRQWSRLISAGSGPPVRLGDREEPPSGRERCPTAGWAEVQLRSDLRARPDLPMVPRVEGPRQARRHRRARRPNRAAWAQATPEPDRSPPTAPAIVGPRTTSSPRPVYKFVASDRRTPRSRLRYRCSFDSRRLHECAARYSQRLAVGRHVLRAQAVDRAGNRSRVTSVTVVVKGRGEGGDDPASAPSTPGTSASSGTSMP